VVLGLDLGDDYSHYCALDRHGEVVAEDRVATKPTALRERFLSLPKCTVALEAGTHSHWVSRLLKELGRKVLVANPRQLPLIYKNPQKTDRTDAEGLARLARLDPRMLKPIRHRSAEEQESMAVLRSRNTLVETRSKLINHARGIVKPLGGKIRPCSAEAFHKVAPEDVPAGLKGALAPVLEIIERVTQQIRQLDKLIEELCDTKYPRTAFLRQVAGVGPVTSLAFMLVLHDPSRFASSRAVGAYLGLTPRKDESGKQKPQLRITKTGDDFLRRLLVNSAQYILGHFGPDTDLRRFGLGLYRQGDKNSRKRAVVAVARKLAVLLHRLWITGEVYEPLRKRGSKAPPARPTPETERKVPA
jgi:transposase